MGMPDKQKWLRVKVDAELAAEYQAAYSRVFGRRGVQSQSLEIFISSFVEDRLCEEIEFGEREVMLPHR